MSVCALQDSIPGHPTLLPVLGSSLASLRTPTSLRPDSSEPFIFQLPPTKKVRSDMLACLASLARRDMVGEREGR